MGWRFRDEVAEQGFYERAVAKVANTGWPEAEQHDYIDGFIDEYFDMFDSLGKFPESGRELRGEVRKAVKASGKDRGAVVIYRLEPRPMLTLDNDTLERYDVVVIEVTSFQMVE